MKKVLFAIFMLILALPVLLAMNSGNLLVDYIYARVDSWPNQPTLPPVNPIPPIVPGNPTYPGIYESPDYLFNTGRTAFVRGNFYDAIHYLRRFIARYPYDYRSAEAHYLVAEAYRRLNDFYNAVSFYRKVSINFPHFSEVHRAAYFIGFCLVKITDYYGAIREFKNFISRFPASELVDDAWYVIGRTYEQINDRANAIIAYRQVIYNYPNSNFYNQALERLNYLQNGGTIYPIPPTYPPINPIPPTYPNNDNQLSDYELYQRGHSELISGNFENARTYFDELIKRYPTSNYADDAYYWKADAWRQQHNYLQAINEFELLMRFYPGSELFAAALYGMASCEFEYGRINYANRSYLQRAASHYTWYQQKYPAGQYAAQALVQAGDCYELLGDYSQARFCYQQTINLYPNSAAAIKANDKLKGYR